MESPTENEVCLQRQLNSISYGLSKMGINIEQQLARQRFAENETLPRKTEYYITMSFAQLIAESGVDKLKEDAEADMDSIDYYISQGEHRAEFRTISSL